MLYLYDIEGKTYSQDMFCVLELHKKMLSGRLREIRCLSYRIDHQSL